MSTIYVDSSILVAVLFREHSSERYRKLLTEAEEVISSALCEAEVFSSSSREKVSLDRAEGILEHISLVIPDRSLREEYREIFSKGYCRSADAHHIACAIYLDANRKDLQFLTADLQQEVSARKVGLRILL